MRRVENLAWNFDPVAIGYEWNEDKCQDYQRHYPEGLGYQILRPIKYDIVEYIDISKYYSSCNICRDIVRELS